MHKPILKSTILGILLFLTLVLGVGNLNVEAKSIEETRFQKKDDGDFFLVYSNLRNYDAYGCIFDNEGNLLEKNFLGQGLTDLGYLQEYKEGVLLANPLQNKDFFLDNQGLVSFIEKNKKNGFLENTLYYPFASSDYLVYLPEQQEIKEEQSQENENILVHVKKNLELEGKSFLIEGQWLESTFVVADKLYVIGHRSGFGFFLDSFDIISGNKESSVPFPLEERGSISIRRQFLDGDRLFLEYKSQGASKVLVYNLSLGQTETILEVPNNKEVLSIEKVNDQYIIAGKNLDNSSGVVGMMYIYNNSLELAQEIELRTTSVEKQIYTVKDVFIRDGKIYSFCEGLTTKEEASNQNLNDFLVLLSVLLGTNNGPNKTNLVYIYDFKTGVYENKVIFKDQELKLGNGVVLPWLLEKSKENEEW